MLGSLTVLDPQPRSIGVQPTRRTYSASGQVFDEALYVELLWDYLDDPTAYQAMLTSFGVNSAKFANVTVYVRDATYNFVRYNGVAVQPETGRHVIWRDYFPRQITMIVKDLTVAS